MTGDYEPFPALKRSAGSLERKSQLSFFFFFFGKQLFSERSVFCLSVSQPTISNHKRLLMMEVHGETLKVFVAEKEKKKRRSLRLAVSEDSSISLSFDHNRGRKEQSLSV